MDFNFTEEQMMLRNTVRNFTDKEIMPYIAQWDREGKFDPAIIDKLAALGLMGYVFQKNTAAVAWIIIRLQSSVKSLKEEIQPFEQQFPFIPG